MQETTRATLGTAYLRTIQVAGVLLLLAASYDVAKHPPGWAWVALTALTAITGAYAVRIPGVVVRLSVSEPIVFLATILFGAAPGTLTAAVDAFVMSMRLPQRLRTPHRILFNVGALAVTVLPSALLYFRLAGLDARSPRYGPLENFVGPLYVFALSVFLFNSALVALAVSLERGVSAFSVWKTQFMWLSASYLASAAIAAILVAFTNAFDVALAGVLLPLVVVTYLAVRTTLGRLDDTNKHLTEVNTLYLSTIETLAMAIDAKDQVTHGHIRRVQRFAVGLAKALGVVDERQLKAIEAAALLHDMGKLAIPEFILNKPGRLTPREFSIMKTHAAVGADLLSSIHFPYPVVPIVRHHHESWDGTGYPDGLRGADIPLGARILSVVDCYDALTSDRPYRPALSATAALDILLQRRGRMYDPLIVDVFVREHAALSAQTDVQELPRAILTASPEPSTPAPLLEENTGDSSPADTLRLLSTVCAPQDGPPVPAVCARLVDSLRMVAPFDTGIVYLLNESSGDAEVAFAGGSLAQSVSRLRVRLAERLTGWVAAHGTAVWNSDASLDLDSTGIASGLLLGSSLPLSNGSHTFGVLSLYGRADQEISASQRRALESLMPALAQAVSAAIRRPGLFVDCTDPVVRAPALAAVESLIAHSRRQPINSQAAVLAVSVSLAGTENSSARLSFLTAEFLHCICPRITSTRCVLGLAPDVYLVCALDGADEGALRSELGAAMALPEIRDLTMSIAAVRTSFELQDLVQRTSERLPSAHPIRQAERIH